MEKFFETLYGMREGSLTAMLSVASEGVPYEYLFGVPLGEKPKQGSTLTVRITAWQNGTTVHRSESEFCFDKKN